MCWALPRSHLHHSPAHLVARDPFCCCCCWTLMFWKLLFYVLSGSLVLSGRWVNIVSPCYFNIDGRFYFFCPFTVNLPISFYLKWLSHRHYPVSQSLHYNGNIWTRYQQTFSVKDQIVNILGLAISLYHSCSTL